MAEKQPQGDTQLMLEINSEGGVGKIWKEHQITESVEGPSLELDKLLWRKQKGTLEPRKDVGKQEWTDVCKWPTTDWQKIVKF